MPLGVFKSVYAVSSEDPSHPASNLLRLQHGKKWKTASTGEKSAFVILQFDKPYQITGIDIGNEHSAFVMVAVGKAGCSSSDFKEILVTSSFMTPTESKSSTNTNRVRYFVKSALVEDIAKQKWDLVKVLCTQPFNTREKYGLSFIKVHVLDDKPKEQEKKSLIPEKFMPKTTATLGHLKLREDSPDSDSESSSALFNRWKKARNGSLSTAAAIRAASNPSTLKTQSESLKPSKIDVSSSSNGSIDKPVLDRNRNDLLFGKDDDISNEKLERRISQDQERLRNEREQSKKKDRSYTETKPKLHASESPSTKESKNTPKTVSKKRPSSPTAAPAKKIKMEKPIQYKPFSKLLEGVVLVISGIQNPERGTLRQKAIQLGAKYKPDWDDSCTHLICAFKNTPKYNQVKGKGKIVTKHWIDKCHSLKKRLPWRRYAIDDKESEKPSSEDEIYDESLRPTRSPSPALPSTSTDQTENPTPQKPQRKSIDEILAHYDVEESSKVLSSGSDTEDEIERIKKKQKEDKEEDVYEISTEEDETLDCVKGKHLKDDMEFFKGLRFFVNDEINSKKLYQIKEYIKKFKGEFVDSVNDSDFAITVDPIQTSSTFKGDIVKPSWIFECNDMECLMPTQRFLVKK